MNGIYIGSALRIMQSRYPNVIENFFHFSFFSKRVYKYGKKLQSFQFCKILFLFLNYFRLNFLFEIPILTLRCQGRSRSPTDQVYIFNLRDAMHFLIGLYQLNH